MSILSSACANQLASLSNVILMFDPKLNESVPYVAELITGRGGRIAYSIDTSVPLNACVWIVGAPDFDCGDWLHVRFATPPLLVPSSRLLDLISLCDMQAGILRDRGRMLPFQMPIRDDTMAWIMKFGCESEEGGEFRRGMCARSEFLREIYWSGVNEQEEERGPMIETITEPSQSQLEKLIQSIPADGFGSALHTVIETYHSHFGLTENLKAMIEYYIAIMSQAPIDSTVPAGQFIPGVLAPASGEYHNLHQPATILPKLSPVASDDEEEAENGSCLSISSTSTSPSMVNPLTPATSPTSPTTSGSTVATQTIPPTKASVAVDNLPTLDPSIPGLRPAGYNFHPKTPAQIKREKVRKAAAELAAQIAAQAPAVPAQATSGFVPGVASGSGSS